MARTNPVDRAEVEVGKRLRKIREMVLLGQRDFAAVLGIGREGFAKYEAGRVPLTFNVGRNVCDEWGVNPMWLAEGTGPQLERYIFQVPEAVLQRKCSFREALISKKLPSVTVRDYVLLALLMTRPVRAQGVMLLRAKDFFPDEMEETKTYFDRSVIRIPVSLLKRDPVARMRSILWHGQVCQGCGLRFDQLGEGLGYHFLEAHYIKPIGEGGEQIAANCVPLCSNCHRMIDLRSPPYSLTELKKMLRKCRR